MHLRYDCYGACLDGECRHPQAVMRELGLSYQHATPQSIADQWWFWNVEGDTENLPSFLSEMDNDPMSCVGYGLSEEDAKAIASYKKD